MGTHGKRPTGSPSGVPYTSLIYIDLLSRDGGIRTRDPLNPIQARYGADGFAFAGPFRVQITTTPQPAFEPANSPGTSLAPV